MDNNNIINGLVVVANSLENNKLYKEAKVVDGVIHKVAAKNKIDMDVRVNSRDETVTKQMIYSYEADVQHVQSMIADKENPANVQALKEIADRTEIALDKPDDYESVLSLLESGLEKYRNHLNELRQSGGEVQEEAVGKGSGKPDIQALVSKKASQYGIPEGLLKAMINQESGGNAGATSPKGAAGIMQLMPATAKGLGVTDIFDVEQNVDAGCRYLKQQYDRFKSWPLALAAYNAGPGAVAKHHGIPPYSETINYVKRIMSRSGLSA